MVDAAIPRKLQSQEDNTEREEHQRATFADAQHLVNPLFVIVRGFKSREPGEKLSPDDLPSLRLLPLVTTFLQRSDRNQSTGKISLHLLHACFHTLVNEHSLRTVWDNSTPTKIDAWYL
jgi:hypothetical protein